MMNKTVKNILLIIGFAAICQASSIFFERLDADDAPAAVMVTHHDQTSKPLDEQLQEHAKKLNAHLNELYNETLFNTKLLRDSKKTGEHLGLPLDQQGHGAEDFTITTQDDEKICTTFINHNSDTLLIIGSGFSYDRRSLASFACYKPDIVLFQPRGQGVDHKPKTFKGRCSYKLFGVDSSSCKLGNVEEHDVIAVTEHYKQQKKYKSVIYLGICYSAVIGAKACALRPDLFDKLILDGAWPSLKTLLERVIKQPGLLRNPQARSSSFHFLANNRLYTSSSRICTEKLFDFKLEEAIAGTDFFPKINKPILFFQGLNDNMVPLCDFNAVWDMTNNSEQKVAILTPSRHIQGHIKHKELYHMLCHMFIDNDFETFKKQLHGEHPLPEIKTKEVEIITKLKENLSTAAPADETVDKLEIPPYRALTEVESVPNTPEQIIVIREEKPLKSH